MLTVIGSMEHELAGIRRGIQSIPAGNALHVVGVGAGPAWKRSSLQSLIDRQSEKASTGTDTGGTDKDQAFLLVGFAGAVDPGLRTGDLVIASRYYRAETPENPRSEGDFLTPDPAMWELAREAAVNAGISVIHSDSVTVDSPAATPAAKAALGRRFSVGAVNMEDYWLAAMARDAGVPFLSVRVILDPASQSIPQYVLGLSQSGPLTVMRTAAMPWRIPTLLRLGHRMRLAQGPLTRFGLSFIKQFNDAHPKVATPIMTGAAS